MGWKQPRKKLQCAQVGGRHGLGMGVEQEDGFGVGEGRGVLGEAGAREARRLPAGEGKVPQASCGVDCDMGEPIEEVGSGAHKLPVAAFGMLRFGCGEGWDVGDTLVGCNCELERLLSP